jgi:hypothetical protein
LLRPHRRVSTNVVVDFTQIDDAAKSSSINNIGDAMTTTTSPINRKRYASTAQAAAYVNYSESHFRALVRAGKVRKPIRPYGPNGKCLFDLDLIDDDLRVLAIEQGVIPHNAA